MSPQPDQGNRRAAWRTAWRIARRDLSARFRGLRLLLVCLFLGVGAISAIGTLTGSIERELATRGKAILGGDIETEVWQRGPTAQEVSALQALGKVSLGQRMQAMASTGSGDTELSAPVALKAVDEAWPLVGAITLKDGRQVRAPPPGTAWLAESVADRLGIKPGDALRISGQTLVLGGIIATDPEQLGEGFAFGASAVVGLAVTEKSGLTAPGAMYRSKAKVLLRAGISPDSAVKRIEEAFPSAGLRLRTRDKAAPGAERFVAQMGEFLVLVGLAALTIAGIGIAGGVASYLEARRGSIATLKVLGATSGDIARVYVLQIGAAALAGSLAGLLTGVLVTPVLASLLGSLLPVTPGLVVDAWALARAALFGLLVALVFAAPPLLRAREFPAMALLRARVSPLQVTWRRLLLPVGGGLAAIVALAMATAAQPLTSAAFLAGSAVLLGLLALLGYAIRRIASQMPRPDNPVLRIALANLHRPGAQTGGLVVALGFGLSAFVLLAAIQTSLDANIRAQVPQKVPDYFIQDVPRDREAEFRAAIAQTSKDAMVRTVPSLRGAILAFGPEGQMTRVADLKEIPEGGWALRGERGLTYADEIPEGNVLTEGKWWPKNHTGPPLVSVDERLSTALDLKVGDRITIGVLGVERSATIASFRRIDWDSLGFNYVLVFSPNTLIDAPHNLAAMVNLPKGVQKGALLRRLVRAFPSSSVIETGTLLRDASALLGQMSTAILSAASVAVLAGLAVLLGAIAAARASRTYDNVIMRVLGASRRQLLLLQLAEYGLLALALAGVALGLGTIAGWLVIVQMFEFDWLPHWPSVLSVLTAGIALILGFALAGSLPLLRAKPAQALREL